MSNAASKYSINVAWSPEDEAFVATSPEWPSLSGVAETDVEAIGELKVALELAVESYERHGRRLPEPQVVHSFSGQFRVRVPKSLHRRLSECAAREDVSLNTYVATALAESVGASAGRVEEEHIAGTLRRTLLEFRAQHATAMATVAKFAAYHATTQPPWPAKALSAASSVLTPSGRIDLSTLTGFTARVPGPPSSGSFDVVTPGIGAANRNLALST